MKKQIKETVEDIGCYFFDYSVDEVIEKLKPYSGMFIEVNHDYDTVNVCITRVREESDQEYEIRVAKEKDKEQKDLERAKEAAKKAAQKEKELFEKLKEKYG